MIRALTSTSIFVTSPGRRWPGNRPRNRDLRENDHRSAQNLNGSHDWAWGRHRSFWVDGFDWAVALATTHYSRGGVTLKLHIETRGIHNLSSVRTLQPIVASPPHQGRPVGVFPPPPSPITFVSLSMDQEREERDSSCEAWPQLRPPTQSILWKMLPSNLSRRCIYRTTRPKAKTSWSSASTDVSWRTSSRDITKRRVGLPQNPWGLRQPYVQSKLPGDFPPVGVPPKVLFFALSILV